MKLIKLFVLMMGLSLASVPLARAQETETPTESPSPTPAETTETKKSEEPTKPEAESATAEKSATPSVKAQKKEKSVRSMAKGSMDSQLKELENRWAAAYQSHDAKVVEEILADGYVGTNEQGKVVNRRGALKEFKKNKDTLEKATSSEMVVHPINHDAAVVTGLAHEVGKDKSGKAFDRSFRWTDTFVNRNGKWQCVASHVTLVGQK